MKNQVRNWKENNVFAFVAASSSPVTVIASSILVQCHSISQHGQLSFMNQHQTHRLCARIHAAIQLPFAAMPVSVKQQQSTEIILEEATLIKLCVHLEAAVRLVREQVEVRSLSGCSCIRHRQRNSG